MVIESASSTAIRKGKFYYTVKAIIKYTSPVGTV